MDAIPRGLVVVDMVSGLVLGVLDLSPNASSPIKQVRQQWTTTSLNYELRTRRQVKWGAK